MRPEYLVALGDRLEQAKAAGAKASSAAGAKVAVVLSGCGVYDGTEVHEAAAALAAITRLGGVPSM